MVGCSGCSYRGVPLYIRLSTMLPIAQALLIKGFPIAPTMALLIGGAGASLPEIIMLKSIFHKKLLGAFIVSVFTMPLSLAIYS